MTVELSGGFINRVCLVDGVVEKEYTGEEKIDKPGGERMMREFLALRRFYPLGIAPQVFWQKNNCLCQEFVEGDNLANLLPTLDNERKKEIFFRLGKILSIIHGVRVRRPISYLKEDLEKKWQRAFKKVVEDNHFALSEIRLIEIDWNEIFRFGTTRVHRDFWPGNVIITSDGEIIIIDWEAAGIGTPYEDFTILELWTFPGEKDEVISAFWEGYGQRPNDRVTLAFLQRRLIQFLATYKGEDPIGFYKHKWELLLKLNSSY